MKLINRLKDLFQSERGNVLAIGAACLPLLMGSAGFAIDATQMALWKRQVQRAADSAAIAGAHARSQGASTDVAVANDVDEHIDYDLEENETPMLTDRQIVHGTFAAGTLSSQSCAVRATAPCYSQAVEVTLTAERRLPFMSLFTGGNTQIRATATAAVISSGEYCLVSLFEGNEPGIISGGNSNLDLKCGMGTNSRATNAVNAFGSATITADPVGAVGGISGGTQFTKGTTLLPYTSPIKDPFAHVPDPVLPAGCSKTSTLSVTGGTEADPIVIDPDVQGNCFGSWDISGHAELKPGTYYINDGALDIKGSLVGDGVTLVMMGDGSSWSQNGGGKISLTAPADGDLAGIVVFRERTATTKNNKEIKLNGGADLVLQGAIYGKSTDFWIGGNAEMDAQCIQIVGRKLEFKGGGTIHNKCEGTGSNAFDLTMVRLVA